ncbi:4-hydroxy-3-methylbut-2-enyl diphosphate reductase [Rhodobiaceae bacterium]|nr:4-hydroxy-3-methylbut-2-enyl diphosphate reductase [Rhodobiaceae bacterium]
MNKKIEKILYLPNPRGFCAGVERAINIVELSLEKYGPPIYVRHEIVHNPWVVKDLESKGVVFVDELDDVPKDARVIFSAHGVSSKVKEEAKVKEMPFIDATCPLVLKVHIEAKRHFENGAHIFLIGHKGHPEVDGTMGQIPIESITLIENLSDIDNLKAKYFNKVALITQTTLSVDDTSKLIKALKNKFPNLIEPPRVDICYATTNRQAAVKSIAKKCDAIYVIGGENSSNSLRLVEVASQSGCKNTFLISEINSINWDEMEDFHSIGLTASASAPEVLINEFLDLFKNKFEVKIEKSTIADENISFKIPKELRE